MSRKVHCSQLLNSKLGTELDPEHRVGKREGRTAVGGLFVIGSLLLGAANIAASGPEDQPKPNPESGWDLVVFPIGDQAPILRHLENASPTIWPATALPPPGIGFSEGNPVGVHKGQAIQSIVAGRGYWIWSKVGALDAARTADDLTWASSSTTTTNGWGLFSVTSTVVHVAKERERVLAWDANAQHYVPVAVGDVLVPGRGYWAYRSTPEPSLAPLCLQADEGSSNGRTSMEHCESPDLEPPVLRVLTPAVDLSYTTNDWIGVEGEADDANLEGIYVNGLEVGQEGHSFFRVLHLEPGENRLIASAVDRSGLKTIVERRIVREPPPPSQIHSTADTSSAGEALEQDRSAPLLMVSGFAESVFLGQEAFDDQDRIVTNRPHHVLWGRAFDTHLKWVTVNGVVVMTQSGPFTHRVRVDASESQLLVRAQDLAGNQTTKRLTVIFDGQAPEFVFSHPRQRTVYRDTTVLRGVLAESHPEVISLRTGAHAEAQQLSLSEGVFEQRVKLAEGSNTFVFFAKDAAGNEATAKIDVTYRTQIADLGRPMPPGGLSGHLEGKTVTLRWRGPRLLEGGAPIPEGITLSYRVYRDGLQVGEIDSVNYKETVSSTASAHRYFVTATTRSGKDRVWESVPSEPAIVRPRAPAVLSTPGVFEDPGLVAEGEGILTFPRSGLARVEDTVYAHVAYVSRASRLEGHHNGGTIDQIQVATSAAAGQDQTFASGTVVTETKAPWQVTDLSLAVWRSRVSVAWIETAVGARKATPISRLYVAKSDDGGKHFGPPQELGQEGDKKRGIDHQYDHRGDHHLVWGEANKVYYVKNLHGEVSNVFDLKKRKPATERVKYKAQYPSDSGCRCPSCWCEEEYPLSEEPNPKDGGRPIGPYLYRVEEAYVYEPALHVDDHKITIIAVQRRMWDNKAVLEPAWQAMMKDPIYSDQIVQRKQPTKLVVGWRQFWKDAYEPHDEDRWEELGSQYQFRYRGSWHENHQVKIAQRPLREGAWARNGHVHASNGSTDGWRRGTWMGDTEQQWRVSLVEETAAPSKAETLAHPNVHTDPSGRVIAVFERGNSVRVSASIDDGTSFEPSRVLGPGAHPKLAFANPDHLAVASGVPQENKTQGPVQFFHRVDGEAFGSPTWAGKAEASLRGAPSLSALEELLFAVWVQKAKSPYDRDRIVSSRASYATKVAPIDLQLPDGPATYQSTPVTLTAQNEFHTQVDEYVSVSLNGPSSDSATPGRPHNGARVSRVDFIDDTSAPPSHVHASHPATSFEGHGLAFAWAEVNGFAQLSAAQDHIGSEEARLALAFAGEGTDGDLVLPSRLVIDNVEGNYRKAITARDALLRSAALDGVEVYYQVEYEPLHSDSDQGLDVSLFDTDAYRDSRHLAGFERVWAYTQGIALAQLSRKEHGSYAREARGMARYLCAHAERGDDGFLIHGWPFSWNTMHDTWKDARLVTGANAWAIHGLGMFLTSEAFKAWEDDDEKEALKNCYLGALEGLKTHRRTLDLEDGRQVSLMTAGWTTEGLERAQAPWTLGSKPEAAPTHDKEERWAYYSVLDAIGYRTFSPTPIRICSQGARCYEEGQPKSAWSEHMLEDEAVWHLLKTRVLAQNVVTEHNLDVLSVLNHALAHSRELGLLDPASLERWRDGLRDGIFYALWDDVAWRTEFESALEDMKAHAPDDVALTAVQAKNRERRKRGLEEALQRDRFGRVVTGGVLSQGNHGNWAWKASRHSAIDNCSWLSLSVNYGAFPDQDDPKSKLYTDRLAECLQYTVLQYAKDLSFGDDGCAPASASCPPRTTYRGTHYFQNAFRDPYIEPSELQESSYHLEATMGMILGLLRFVETHPERPEAHAFAEEASRLWAGAQHFVRDQGFPYSSQRIQDLSTLLASSTAAIWFIDVHDYLDGLEAEIDRPLRHYASGMPPSPTRASFEDAYQAIRSRRAETWHEADAGLEVLWTITSSLTETRENETFVAGGRANIPEGAHADDYLVKLPSPTEHQVSREEWVRLWGTQSDAPAYGVTLSSRHRRAYIPVNSAELSVRAVLEGEGTSTRLILMGSTDIAEPDNHVVRLAIFQAGSKPLASAFRPFGAPPVEVLLGSADINPTDGSFSLRLPDLPSDALLATGIPLARLVRKSDLAEIAVTSPIPAGHDETLIAHPNDGFMGRTFVGQRFHWYVHAPTAGVGVSLVQRDWTTRIVSGLSDEEGRRPYTLLEDQAMAVMVGTAQGDAEAAEAWASDLLLMRVYESVDGNDRLRFPWVTYADDGFEAHLQRDLATEMLAHHALALFLARFPNTPLKDPIQETLVVGLDTLSDLYREGDRGGLTGLYRETASLVLAPPKAKIETNIDAFFALEAASLALENTLDGRRLAAEAKELRTQLLSLCGGDSDSLPVAEIYEDRRVQAHRPGTLSRCALFAVAAGRPDTASKLLDAVSGRSRIDGATLQDAQALGNQLGIGSSPNVRPQSMPPLLPRAFKAHFAMEILARRALASSEPRQEEIAVFMLESLRQGLKLEKAQDDGSSVGHTLAALLVERPGGAFGVDPFGSQTSDWAVNPTEIPGSRDVRQMERRLAHRALDRLFALVASEFQRHRFDMLFRELVGIRAAEAQIFGRQSLPTEREWMLSVEHELRHRLCDPSLLLHRGTVSLEEFFGLECAALQSAVDALFRARGSTGDDHWVTLVEGPSVTAFRHRMLAGLAAPVPHPQTDGARVLGTEGAPGFGVAPSALAFDRAGLLEIAPQASLAQVRQGLRGRMTAIIEAPFRQALAPAESVETGQPAESQPKPIVYDLLGIDPVRVFNPAAPEYWQSHAIALRLALSSSFRDQVRFAVRARPVRAPAFPLSPQEARNVRFLRRAINTEWNGALMSMADAADVTYATRAAWMGQIHRVLRTGILSESGFDTLVRALGLSNDAVTLWKDALVLVPDDEAGLLPIHDIEPLIAELSVLWSRDLPEEPTPVTEAGGLRMLLPKKAPGRLTRRALLGLNKLVELPPWLAASVVPAAGGFGWAAGGVASLGVGFFQPDSGLDTIFVRANTPDAERWTPVGTVRASDLIAEPTQAYLRSEEEIRHTVPIYVETNAVDPRTGPTDTFDDDAVYLIHAENLNPVNTPVGALSVLPSTQGVFWGVYRLNTTLSRQQIVAIFVDEWLESDFLGPFTEAVVSVDGIPDPARRAEWRWLVELAALEAFDLSDAERISGEPHISSPVGWAADGYREEASAPIDVEIGAFDPYFGQFPIKASRVLEEDEMLTLYCSDDPELLRRLSGRNTLDYSSALGNAGFRVVDFTRADLKAGFGLTPENLRFAPDWLRIFYCRARVRQRTATVYEHVWNIWAAYKKEMLDPKRTSKPWPTITQWADQKDGPTSRFMHNVFFELTALGLQLSVSELEQFIRRLPLQPGPSLFDLSGPHKIPTTLKVKGTLSESGEFFIVNLDQTEPGYWIEIRIYREGHDRSVSTLLMTREDGRVTMHEDEDEPVSRTERGLIIPSDMFDGGRDNSLMEDVLTHPTDHVIAIRVSNSQEGMDDDDDEAPLEANMAYSEPTPLEVEGDPTVQVLFTVPPLVPPVYATSEGNLSDKPGIQSLDAALGEWAFEVTPLVTNGIQVQVDGMGLFNIPKAITAPGSKGTRATPGSKVRVQKGLLKAMEALLRQDPATAGIGSALAATLGLFLTEPTQGVETIFMVDALPPEWEGLWVQVGWVEAASVFDTDQGNIGYLRETPWVDWYGLRSEDDIRAQVPIFTSASTESTKTGFEEDRIYLFEKQVFEANDIPGFDQPGLLDVVLPSLVSHIEEGELLKTYVLNTEESAHEITEQVLSENPAWQWFLEVGKNHPALLEAAWVNTMRAYLLGTYFTAEAAVTAASRKTIAPKGAPPNSGGPIVHSSTPQSISSSGASEQTAPVQASDLGFYLSKKSRSDAFQEGFVRDFDQAAYTQDPYVALERAVSGGLWVYVFDRRGLPSNERGPTSVPHDRIMVGIDPAGVESPGSLVANPAFLGTYDVHVLEVFLALVDETETVLAQMPVEVVLEYFERRYPHWWTEDEPKIRIVEHDAFLSPRLFFVDRIWAEAAYLRRLENTAHSLLADMNGKPVGRFNGPPPPNTVGSGKYQEIPTSKIVFSRGVFEYERKPNAHGLMDTVTWLMRELKRKGFDRREAIFVIEFDGVYLLDEGLHRSVAMRLLRQETIPAIVFKNLDAQSKTQGHTAPSTEVLELQSVIEQPGTMDVLSQLATFGPKSVQQLASGTGQAASTTKKTVQALADLQTVLVKPMAPVTPSTIVTIKKETLVPLWLNATDNPPPRWLYPLRDLTRKGLWESDAVMNRFEELQALQGLIALKSIGLLSAYGDQTVEDLRTLSNNHSRWAIEGIDRLRQAKLVSVRPANKKTQLASIVHLEQKNFESLRNFLSDLFPGDDVDITLAKKELKILFEPGVVLILNRVAARTETTLVSLKNQLPALPHLEATVAKLVDEELLLQDKDTGALSIDQETGSSLGAYLDVVLADEHPVSEEAFFRYQQLHALALPPADQILDVVATKGGVHGGSLKRTTGLNIGPLNEVVTALVAANLLRLEPTGSQLKLSTQVHLDEEGISRLVRYLKRLSPGASFYGRHFKDELTLLSKDKNLLLLDRLSKGRRFLHLLPIDFPDLASSMEDKLRVLRLHGFIETTELRAHIDKTRGSGIAAYLERLLMLPDSKLIAPPHESVVESSPESLIRLLTQFNDYVELPDGICVIKSQADVARVQAAMPTCELFLIVETVVGASEIRGYFIHWPFGKSKREAGARLKLTLTREAWPPGHIKTRLRYEVSDLLADP